MYSSLFLFVRMFVCLVMLFAWLVDYLVVAYSYILQKLMTKDRYEDADDLTDRHLMYPFRIGNAGDASSMRAGDDDDFFEEDAVKREAREMIGSFVLQQDVNLSSLITKKNNRIDHIQYILQGVSKLATENIRKSYGQESLIADKTAAVIVQESVSAESCDNILKVLYEEPAEELCGDEESNDFANVGLVNEERFISASLDDDLIAADSSGKNLSADQQFVLDMIRKKIKVDEVFQFLLEGGPGTGKTYLVKEIEKVAKELKGVSMPMLFMALTGSAASNLPNGSTIHSALGLDISRQTLLQTRSLRPMDSHFKADRLESLKNRSGSNGIWVVDEISMVSTVGLSHINERCVNVRDSHTDPNESLMFKSFGGFNFIGVGDHFQIPPG